MSLINHSRGGAVNATFRIWEGKTKRRVLIEATKRIEANHEILLDYGYALPLLDTTQ